MGYIANLCGFDADEHSPCSNWLVPMRVLALQQTNWLPSSMVKNRSIEPNSLVSCQSSLKFCAPVVKRIKRKFSKAKIRMISFHAIWSHGPPSTHFESLLCSNSDLFLTKPDGFIAPCLLEDTSVCNQRLFWFWQLLTNGKSQKGIAFVSGKTPTVYVFWSKLFSPFGD